MTPKLEMKLTGEAIKITLAQTDPSQPPAELLVLTIAIDCPLCGQHAVKFAGHHLRTLRDLLIEMVDLHPGLCGPDADTTAIERLELKGEIPPDPSTN